MERVFNIKLNDEYRALVRYVMQGKSNFEIAHKMSYSKTTVQNHLNKLFRLYGAKNRFDFIIAIMSELVNKNKILINELEVKNSISIERITLLEDLLIRILKTINKNSIPQNLLDNAIKILNI